MKECVNKKVIGDGQLQLRANCIRTEKKDGGWFKKELELPPFSFLPLPTNHIYVNICPDLCNMYCDLTMKCTVKDQSKRASDAELTPFLIWILKRSFASSHTSLTHGTDDLSNHHSFKIRVTNSVSDPIWNVVTISPPVLELWCHYEKLNLNLLGI